MPDQAVIPAHVSHVFVDIGDTLASINQDFETYTREAIKRILTCSGINPQENDLINKVYKLRTEIRSSAHETLHETSISEFLNRAAKEIDSRLQDPDLLEKEYVTAELEITECFNDSASFLDRARAQGKELIVATNNFSPVHVAELLEKFELSDYFDDYIISGETSYRKPHEQFLIPFMRRRKISPAESIIIGDKPHMDIEVARACKMSGILIDRKNNYPDYTEMPKVNSLHEIHFE